MASSSTAVSDQVEWCRKNAPSRAYSEMESVEDAEGISGGEAVEDFFHYVLKNVPIKNGRDGAGLPSQNV